jgi:uncharacterized protein (TIGR03790 family)
LQPRLANPVGNPQFPPAMRFFPALLLPVILAIGAGRAARAATAAATPTSDTTLAARVVILANSADPESVALARYYAEKRGIPRENIVSLRLPTAEIISRAEFDEQLYQPLQDELVRRKWLDGLAVNTPNPAPRRHYSFLGHRISYLVVCRGVPLYVGGQDLPDDNTPITGRNAQLRNNSAAVDAELALLARNGWPLMAFVANPLFNRDNPSALLAQQVVKVARLDGPTSADARGLVDRALAAEATGLLGRGYIDLGGPHADGDVWLEDAARQLAALGFDTDTDRAKEPLGPAARFDAPALYFGWYSQTVTGPFAADDFRFPPGAVALHIFSYSASTLRDPRRSWAATLVARGVTATFGNTSEPFLQFTHQPQLVLRALARGDPLGDAAAYALPYFSWMGVLIGDPLYRPFKVSFDEQWEKRASLPAALRPYLVARKMLLLDAAKRHGEAVTLGLEEQDNAFSLPVALTLAGLMRAARNDAAAVRALVPALAPTRQTAPADAPLLAAIAAQLTALGEKSSALLAWQRVLAAGRPDRQHATAWLPAAAAAARAAGDLEQAARWEAEAKELAAAAEPKK